MSEKPEFEEIRDRIQRHADHHGGQLPEQLALAWSGYLAALIEWDLVSVSDHERLVSLVPQLENDPAVEILLGTDVSH